MKSHDVVPPVFHFSFQPKDQLPPPPPYMVSACIQLMHLQEGSDDHAQMVLRLEANQVPLYQLSKGGRLSFTARSD